MTTPSYQPPPDTSGYVDLRIYDVTEQQIIDAALAATQQNLPEWTPSEASTEVLLMEGLGLQVSEAVVAINRLPGAVLETLLRFAGVEKDYGAAPTAVAQVVCADTAGHTIPGGTRFYLPTADGSDVVVMLVEPPGVDIPTGQTTGTVSLIGDVYTDRVNGVPIGTPLQMVAPLPFVDTAVLTTAVADGRSPENNDQWRDRGVNRLSRLSEALVLPRHFEAAALENANVSRAVAVDNTDPTTAGTGDDPGHITVAVLGDGGAALSAAAKLEIEQALEDQAIAILNVHVVDITVTTVTLSVTVHLSDASDPAGTSAAVKNAIIAYIDPLTWEYGTVVRRNEIVSLVDQVPGVDYVQSVTITGGNGNGDFVLPTASAVPDATAASVTVSLI